MKTAAVALRGFLASIARAVDIEGAFLIVGTFCLANGAAYFSPAGPWLVVGGVGLITALALVVPARSH